MNDQTTATAWPPLPYEEWRETRNTLHMYTQVIGKLRLALSPFEPQWGHVPLYVTTRGLTTSPMPVGLGTIDAEFDRFIGRARTVKIVHQGDGHFFCHYLTLTLLPGNVLILISNPATMLT